MDYAEKGFVETTQTKERSAAALLKKFSSLTRAISTGASKEELIAAYNEVMSDCDELSLLANRAQYIVNAQASDVRDIRQVIDSMKQEALVMNAELEELLKENEIRVQVASLNALPTREALQSAYDMEMERELKPIEVQKALVARKVSLHRKHLGVLLAAIQQMESELEVDHEFTDFVS